MRGVQWIHPSYRDLVVEELRADDRLRSRFLEVADLEGIKLAVSQAGGTSGQRCLPLLITVKDWELLSERCLCLFGTDDDERTIQLLRVLRSATVDLDGEDRTRMVDTLSACCEAVRKKWDESRAAVKEGSLRELFDASVLIDPLPVAPRLGPTWNSATSALRRSLRESAEKSVSLDAPAVLEWAKLTGLLVSNEPRFMRQVNFPKAFVGDIAQLLVSAEAEAEADTVPERPDDIWAEADRMSTLEQALTALANAVPRMRRRLQETRSIVSSAEDQLREAYKETARDEDAYLEEEADGDSRATPAFDLDALFSDL
jgi:hypothetical protein